MQEDIVLRIFDLCGEKGIMLSVCESLTGGLVADTLIGRAGASEFFYEGIVAYSNEAKIRRLAVKAETLEKFGAVSGQTAEEMAIGLYNHGVDVNLTKNNVKRVAATVSTTGIAGPGGGSAEKPVGLTYIGVCVDGKAWAQKFIFKGNREEIRIQAKDKALELLEEGLKNASEYRIEIN
jgi:nicotinamide-nucleotide amidase